MITISSKMYEDVARILLDELRNGTHFYSGRIEYDTEQFYSTLTCTLIIYRKEESDQIAKIIPVWWDFSICADGVDEINDFSWREFMDYLPA